MSWLIQQMKTHCTIDTFRYVFLSTLFLFDYIIIELPGWIIKTLIGIILLWSLFIPYVCRFMRPAVPIIAWLLTFYACQFIPMTFRPSHIFVNVLPTLERILYGGSLSEIISKHTHPVLDIMAWLPYGVFHYCFPFILAFILFIFGPPRSVNIFGQAFGYMNIAGVLTQLLFPNASPWYEISFGSTPADYSIHGQPGGLERIDDILGLQLYGSTFGGSPLVFGAFPSLHSASATIEMLFIVYLCPTLWPLGVVYTIWLWWSTMYLTHHYLIDLVGGSIYAFVTFFIAWRFLPQVDPKKRNRLAYFDDGIPMAMTWRSSVINFIYSIEYSRCFGQGSQEKDGKLGGVDEESLALSPECIQDKWVPGSATTSPMDHDDAQAQGICIRMESLVEEEQQRLPHHQEYYCDHTSFGNRTPSPSQSQSPDDEICTVPNLSSCDTSPISSELNSPTSLLHIIGWKSSLA